MSDILTQIQDELDFVRTCPPHPHLPPNTCQLLNMMQRQMAYIRLNAPPAVPAGQQRVDTFTEIQAKTASEQPSTTTSLLTQAPTQQTGSQKVAPEQFQEDIKEFARDIVIKQQQMEALIANLPGLNVSEEQQVERMKELERELEGLEGDRLEAVKEKEVLLRRVEEKIMGVGRVR
jgi:mediator of RNA polymerase II transcription subunit 21